MNIELKTIQDHLHHHQIIEDLLGFQFWLNNKVADVYNADMEYSKNHMSAAFVHGLFSLNLLSLYASFMTSQQNLLHQTVTNLRTIYESIPKMYYISFFPNEIRDILLKDQIVGKSDEDAINSLKSNKTLDFFENKELGDLKIFVKELGHKYYFKWFVRKIYSESQIKQLESTFGLLSISSHSSVARKQYASGYEKEETGDIFELIELLSFFNILAQANGHKEMMDERKYPIAELTEFVEKIRGVLAKDGKMSSLFPDHPEIINKLIISPPRAPWH